MILACLISVRDIILSLASGQKADETTRMDQTTPHKTRASAEAGFTLLEVMAAFIIAALASAVLYHAGFNGVTENITAARYQEALVRAQSRLASIGTLTPVQPARLSGDDGGGYSWRLDITPAAVSGPLTLYNVRVTERFGRREVSLATEVLAKTS
jgi:general secretion pathway protein I